MGFNSGFKGLILEFQRENVFPQNPKCAILCNVVNINEQFIEISLSYNS